MIRRTAKTRDGKTFSVYANSAGIIQPIYYKDLLMLIGATETDESIETAALEVPQETMTQRERNEHATLNDRERIYAELRCERD